MKSQSILQRIKLLEELSAKLTEALSSGKSKPGEKYFKWTEKIGRGEKPVTLTMTHILNTWGKELNTKNSNNDITLRQFVKRCDVDEVWETDTEKLVCTKTE